MTDTERLAFMMKCLKEDFGISSQEQFYEEFNKMKPIDISVFTAPINDISKKEIIS
ncbi:hypothetical protein [Aminipila terrae]|uniref:Uncharacterized protein n=1 Tax=Aminipila terrae TaxID=2697030 RepID=A0A6P1MNW6_9FIRM|nr:hypothetical protein [Aminipila terrae]QHI73808.1 hypothetical protein Ami3637_16725 [Aminipila terrae]